ncbi:MAG: glycine cleavage system protein GcvH [Thermoplasmata archaeon]
MTKIPENLKYTRTHEWVRIIGDNAVVGITDFAQEELHEIVFVEVPEVGKEVARGSELAAVESVKARSEIFAPLSGTVVKVNSALVEGAEPARPELINEDPYGNGWIVELRLGNAAEVSDLLSPSEYGKLLESKKG